MPDTPMDEIRAKEWLEQFRIALDRFPETRKLIAGIVEGVCIRVDVNELAVALCADRNFRDMVRAFPLNEDKTDVKKVEVKNAN